MPISQTILGLFPGLVPSECEQTSDPTPQYNCIAHAAGDNRRWWQPLRPPYAYWPKGAPRQNSLAAYEKAFECLGYRRCLDDATEKGFEKIAIFVSDKGPSHAARQLPDGAWTSKLGKLEDIRHALRQIEGAQYGMVALLMKRAISA